MHFVIKLITYFCTSPIKIAHSQSNSFIKNAKNHFLLLKKFKNTESAQPWIYYLLSSQAITTHIRSYYIESSRVIMFVIWFFHIWKYIFFYNKISENQKEFLKTRTSGPFLALKWFIIINQCIFFISKCCLIFFCAKKNANFIWQSWSDLKNFKKTENL